MKIYKERVVLLRDIYRKLYRIVNPNTMDNDVEKV